MKEDDYVTKIDYSLKANRFGQPTLNCYAMMTVTPTDPIIEFMSITGIPCDRSRF